MKIRKRFWLPLLVIVLFVVLSLLQQDLLRRNPPYTDELNGVAEEYYQSPHLPNGDSLLLVKIKDVDFKDFEKFVQDRGMKPLNNFSDMMGFDFHLEQEWWPSSETFKAGQKFHRQDQDGRSELFACLIGDICYISLKTW